MPKGKDKICLIIFREEMGIEEVVEELYLQQKNVLEKLGAGPDKKIDDIIVVYRNLGGAIYNARTIDSDYWCNRKSATGPGRVSTIFHPMYMQEKAIEKYLESCLHDNSLPVILADITTVTERRLKNDAETVGRSFRGLREVIEELAGEENLTYVETKINDLIKA